jgi:predicted dehydrogenase
VHEKSGEENTMKPIRTAIFGTGFMGRVHLEAVRRVESVEAAAIAGRNAEAARRLGAGFSIPTIATDYRDILRDPAIDAVHICTPNAQHFPKLLGPDDYIETAVDTEDFGAAIFRMGARTRGSVTASQISAGRKNRLSIEIYGTRSSVAWDQERPDELWAGHRDAGNQIFVKDPSLLRPAARGYADLPGGHSEGYDDTFKQVFRRFYASISAPGPVPEYPQFVDGLRQLTILKAALQSHQIRGWVNLPQLETGK